MLHEFAEENSEEYQRRLGPDYGYKYAEFVRCSDDIVFP